MVLALIGGVTLGLGAVLFLLSHGRVAGISGIYGGIFGGSPGRDVRLAFVAGLVITGLVLRLVWPTRFGAAPVGPAAVALAGLLVGIGTRCAGGCTSGHGVCGLGRGSVRSLVATLTFMATGLLAVLVVRHVLGAR